MALEEQCQKLQALLPSTKLEVQQGRRSVCIGDSRIAGIAFGSDTMEVDWMMLEMLLKRDVSKIREDWAQRRLVECEFACAFQLQLGTCRFLLFPIGKPYKPLLVRLI